MDNKFMYKSVKCHKCKNQYFEIYILNPVRSIEALGYYLHNNNILMPIHKVHKLSNFIDYMSNQHAITKRQRARILGSINFISVHSKAINSFARI